MNFFINFLSSLLLSEKTDDLMPLHLTVEDNYVKIVAYATVANATV